jgi:hypothetical protein
VRRDILVAGQSRSCGCLRRDLRVPVDEEAFDRDRPESRYWLGFLLADGYVSQSGITLRLADGDRGHVEAFRAFLGSAHAIRIEAASAFGGGPVNGDRRQVTFNATSVRLAASARAHGVRPNKTKTAAVPPALAGDVDFWRGVVDGDGWLCYGRHRGSATGWEINLGLCGTRAVCEGFATFAAHAVGPPLRAESYAVLPIKSIWRVKLTGYQALRMADLLYTDACIALPRKKAAADAFAALASNL